MRTVKTMTRFLVSVSRVCTDFYVQRQGIQTLSQRVTKEKHVFKRMNNWESKREFVEALVQNVLYNKDGLVVINKPYGIGQSSPIKVNAAAYNKHLFFGNEYFLSDVLPELADATGYKNLSIIKTPERYSSGVSLFAGNTEVETRVSDRLKLARSRDVLTNKYLVLSLSIPNVSENKTKVGVKLERSPNKNISIPVLATTWSKRQIEKQQVKTVIIQHRLLEKSEVASLIEVEPSRTKSHVLRLYLATQLLSPILGDNICGSRVKPVFGNYLLIDHWSDAASSTQKIPTEVLQRLKVNPKEASLVPAHIHLHSVTIVDYFAKKKDLVIVAPPPESFLFSCSRLGIRYFENEQTQYLEGT